MPCKAKRWLSAASLTLAVALTGWSGQGRADDAYPTRAINILTGFAPGGTTDLVGRIAAQYLSKKWNVPINVTNEPGGNTVPSNLDLYKAAPDGYTLYSDTIGSSSILPVSVSNLRFNVLDRTFVSMISSNSMIIFVASDSPLQTLKDVMNEAKKDPAGFTWTGVGVAEIPMRQLLKAAGVDILKTKPVVSTGSVGGAVLTAGGNVKVGIAAVGPALSPIAAGLIRPLAIASEKRWPTLPDVPTTAEAGYPDAKVVSWIGITGPPNLPDAIVEKWNAGIAQMVKDPAIVSQLMKLGSSVDYRSAPDFRTEVVKEVKDFGDLWNAP